MRVATKWIPVSLLALIASGYLGYWLKTWSSNRSGGTEKPYAEVRMTTSWAEEMIAKGSYWQYMTADYFVDGGSCIMGFINQNGEILYVWFDFSISSSKHQYRHCYLQRSYNDPLAVEIPKHSDLEAQVIKLIEESHSHKVIERYLHSKPKAIEILKTRDLGLRLLSEIQPTKPRTKMQLKRLPVAPTGFRRQ